MQFFEHQDQARGRTTLLVALFAFSVLLLIGLTSLVAHLVLVADLKPGEPLSHNHWNLVATSGIATFGVIFLGSASRIAQLSAGGVAVAETLGGTLITADSPDLLERRAVNVVEEMAIAAGLPVPPVYIMQRELGINAFAAGWSPDDAVIGLTKGALEAFTRDQLQGVVAHEFSHILNRDCALNLRLLGVLHGIVLISIIGRFLIQMGTGSRHRSTKSDGAPPFLILGFAIWVFGSLGVLIARVIQSAVSRQREYLADASAVQFTRNPEGIAGALATIGSQTSALVTPRAGETSHMLIAEPSTTYLFGFESHPPLFERIKRVLPRWDGEFAALATPPGTVRRIEQRKEEEKELNAQKIAQELLRGRLPGMPEIPGTSAALDISGALVLDAVTSSDGAAAQGPNTSLPPELPGDALVVEARRLLANIPTRLKNAANDPFSARALILSWVLDETPDDRLTQLSLVGADVPLAAETERLAALLPTLNTVAILPLFDLAVGSLAALSPRQKQEFHALLSAVAAQLSARSYRGYCLASLALRHLDPKGKMRELKPLLIKDAIETTLGILAVEGQNTPEDIEKAFASGTSELGTRGKSLKMPGPSSLNVRRLDAAFSTLLRLPTTTRAELLQAAKSVASYDGVLRPSEAELLRTMATCLGVAARPAFATADT